MLVINAEMRTRHELEAALLQAEMSVQTTASARIGLLLAQVVGADLIVAELSLSDMPASAFVQEMRRHALRTPVVFVTDEPVTAAVDRSRSATIECVAKPIEFEQLLSVASRLVGAPKPIDWRVRRVMDMIEEQYARPELTLANVAQEVGIAHEYLCRLLKRDTGATFVEHVRRVRIREATRLLVSTSMSIKEIAGLTGFQTPSQFDRTFRRCRECSPKAYRQLSA